MSLSSVSKAKPANTAGDMTKRRKENTVGDDAATCRILTPHRRLCVKPVICRHPGRCSISSSKQASAEACMASVSVDGRKACSDLMAAHLRQL